MSTPNGDPASLKYRPDFCWKPCRRLLYDYFTLAEIANLAQSLRLNKVTPGVRGELVPGFLAQPDCFNKIFALYC
jgi:hypothetical protein